jgi:hypothetical protein
MKKSLLWFLLILALGFLQETSAQKIVNVYLKNGVKITGAGLEAFEEDAITLRIDRVLAPIVISEDRILKIMVIGDGMLSDNIIAQLSQPPGLTLNSLYHEFRGGLLAGSDDAAQAIHMINGYQFNQYVGTGLGFGMNQYGNFLTLPLYASWKGYLKNKKASPFLFGDIGYGFAWNTESNIDAFEIDNVKGGLYWQAGAGYQINFYNSAVNVALGYVQQHSSLDYVYRFGGVDGARISEERLLRRISVCVGFSF